MSATRTGPRLHHDPARVLPQLFVPGHHLGGGLDGQASEVVRALLDIDDDAVELRLADVMARFAGRHRDLPAVLGRHADRLANRLDPRAELTDARRLLLGALFTSEFAMQGAAVCNPSLVLAPDQAGAGEDSARIVMSLRQIGEGHVSTLGFRTGTVNGSGRLTLDPVGPFASEATVSPSPLDAASFRADARHAEGDGDDESTDWLLEGLGDRFTVDELTTRLAALEAQRDTRRHVLATAQRVRALAARWYTASFPDSVPLSERVLRPATAVESHGIEDARFVRFTDDDGTTRHHATYTAFDGRSITLQLATTTDFTAFAVSPLVGPAAANKGFALFPRRIGGRFAALSRNDGASNSVAFSDDIGHWPTAEPLDVPTAPWEILQRGNCGSPLETAEGWLVLTHGVGSMRTYAIGAWLLDLEDPTKVLGHLAEPLLQPTPAEQDGYVPNVVYSCGALLHRGTVVIPYGVGDAAIDVATVPLSDLLGAMRRPG